MPGLLETVKGWFGAKAAENLELLAAVVENPDDDQPRLAYAAWLTEQGDPRGEFIRLGCEFKKFDEHDPQHRKLYNEYWQILNKHAKAWVKPMKELELEPMYFNRFFPQQWFDRGFIQRLTIYKRGIIPGKVERLFELAPLLRDIEFDRCSPDWSGIAECAFMSRIRRLKIEDKAKIGEFELIELLNSPHLANLTELMIDSKKLTPAVFEGLADSPIRQLKVLNLRGCRLNTEGVQALAAWPGLATVEELDLSNSKPGQAGMQALLHSPNLKSLVSFEFDSGRLGEDNALEALRTAELPQLRKLDLSSNSIKSEDLPYLLESPLLSQLTALNLGGNRFGDEGIQALAANPAIANLQSLSLGHCEIGPQGAKALFTSPHLGPLKFLEISYNPLTQEGIDVLLACPQLDSLHELEARGKDDRDQWRDQLVACFGEEIVTK